MTAPIVGIDLGTTHSLVGAVIDGRMRLFSRPDGTTLLPSVVGVGLDGSVLVGREARNRRLLDPEGTVTSVKRRMGEDVRLRLGDRELSPPEISAQILAALLDMAEAELGQRPSKAVITVPAYFDEHQRQATKDAGEIAGLEVARLVNEPTAAALTYETGQEELVLVYDLGGGTFDVSVLERDEGFMEVRASHGDTRLGGDDLDAALTERVLETLGKRRAQVEADPHAMTRLVEAVERAKIELSSREATRIHEPFLTGEGPSVVNLDHELTRADVEEVAQPLLERTVACIDTALGTAGVAAADLDRVLLVGGASQMPRVAALVEDHLDRPLQLAESPDRAVALGAARLAGRMDGSDVDEILVDITPFTLGAGVFARPEPGLVSSPVIARSTVVPTEKTATYYTLWEDQEAVEVPVCQGEAHRFEDNTEIGEVTVADLPPSPEASPVDVVFRLDLSGVLHVSATHRPSGQRATATIAHGPQRLTEQHREEARALHRRMREPSSTAPAASPAPDGAVSDGQLRLARSLIRRAERALDGAGIDAPLRTRVTEAAAALQAAIDEGEGIAERTEALTDALYDLD
ncbi:MAG TPA: Hsp70 family protein [Sandaracinaceae bacterium LLY-WYZ-13_1]|nr:Hsp70 family protein [Sandaracinaceae bacterium LLY-WYZ-13_1]